MRLGALARERPEHRVPDWRGNAESIAVVLEMVAHVLFAKTLAELGLRDGVMKVIVRVVVHEIPDEKACEEGKHRRHSEDQPEDPEEEERQWDARAGRHDQAHLV